MSYFLVGIFLPGILLKIRTKKHVKMEVYAAPIDRLDHNIGKLIDYLETTGEKDNTVIFFLSDNGGIKRGSESLSECADRYRCIFCII